VSISPTDDVATFEAAQALMARMSAVLSYSQLGDLWASAPVAVRHHVVTHNPEWWTAIKASARQADKSAAGAT
jgi:hypothetical protein